MKEILRGLFCGLEMNSDQIRDFVSKIYSKDFNNVQLAGVLASLATRGETVEEIFAFVKEVLKYSTSDDLVKCLQNTDSIDIVGTGGDGKNTFNISTFCAIVMAASGYKVCKHGNRAVSGKFGSADFMALLGLPFEMRNFNYLFAPDYHPIFANVKDVRLQIGVKTIFNLLGPLLNPAMPKFGLIGVYDVAKADIVARVIAKMQYKRCVVVSGMDGMDEVSVFDKTQVFVVQNGEIERFVFDPADYGLDVKSGGIEVGSEKDILCFMEDLYIFDRSKPICRAVLVNLAFAIFAVEGASIDSCMLKAEGIMSSGVVQKYIDVNRVV